MKNILFVVIGIFLVSCSSDEPQLVVKIRADQINFSNMAVGQKTYYLNFHSTCEDFGESFTTTGDTLLVEIVAQNDSLFFEESLTWWSPTSIENKRIDTIRHFVDVYADKIILPNRNNSSLFYFYGNDTIKINPKYTVLLDQNGCRMMLGDNPFVGEELGLIRSFGVGPYLFEDKTVVSCVPVFYRLEGYLIYDQYQLYASQTMVNDQVSGWVKLLIP